MLNKRGIKRRASAQRRLRVQQSVQPNNSLNARAYGYQLVVKRQTVLARRCDGQTCR